MGDERPGLHVQIFYWAILLYQSSVERWHRLLDRAARMRPLPPIDKAIRPQAAADKKVAVEVWAARDGTLG